MGEFLHSSGRPWDKQNLTRLLVSSMFFDYTLLTYHIGNRCLYKLPSLKTKYFLTIIKPRLVFFKVT